MHHFGPPRSPANYMRFLARFPRQTERERAGFVRQKYCSSVGSRLEVRAMLEYYVPFGDIHP